MTEWSSKRPRVNLYALLLKAFVDWSSFLFHLIRSPIPSQSWSLLEPSMFPVVYDRPVAARDTFSGKRSTKPVTSQNNRYVKKEVTQLSPVKKRIKENKDHYIGKLFMIAPVIVRLHSSGVNSLNVGV